MTTLELKNIVKRYKTNTVLDDLSLDVANGETLVLFGPSGAGKTVLLRLVAGVIDPDEGKILIGGEDMSDVDAEHRGIGMAFQNFALFPHMSAHDNIASPLTAARSSTDAIRSGVGKVAKLLKIDHVLSHHPKALSNGQKQRTALARALAGSPPLLLLDDPLRNVDAKLRFEMRLELPRLLASQGATVVYVTQDYKEAMALGDRIAVMAKYPMAGLPLVCRSITRRSSDPSAVPRQRHPFVTLLEGLIRHDILCTLARSKSSRSHARPISGGDEPSAAKRCGGRGRRAR